MKIGAQFYTLRNFCKTPEDLALSLRKVADIGYTTIQLSATCDFDAQWMKEQLAMNGLTCVLTHTAPAKLQEDLKTVCDDHKTFGCPNIGLGYYSFKNDPLEDTYKQFCDTFRPVAEGVKAEGLYFMYHNHNSEFRKLNGKTILDKLAEDFRVFRNYGSERRYYNKIVGANSRLDEMQAGLLRVRLNHVEAIEEERMKIAARYEAEIQNPKLIMPKVRENCTAVWHQFVLRCEERDRLITYLDEKGIGTIIHYPIPPHLAEAYAYLGFKEGDFPMTERLAKEVLSIPMYNGMTEEEQTYVIDALNAF